MYAVGYPRTKRTPFLTPEHAMIATPLILAIDLGKFNSVFCRFDPATNAMTIRTVPSTPEAIREALLGTASVFRGRLREADERTIPAQPSDHRVGQG